MNRKVSFDCVAGWWQGLSDIQKSAFADDPLKVSAFLNARVKDIEEGTFVIHLPDQEAIQLLIQWKDYTKERAMVTVKSWRKYASDMGYNGPVAWKVKQGFTLKTTAPLAGPCYDKGKYFQDWNFTDTPTVDSLVFWVPRLAERSMDKSLEQMELLRNRWHPAVLPEHHCDRFGSIQLLFALILAHFKRTGEQVPSASLYVVADTLDAYDHPLIAGDFQSGGLHCCYWLDPTISHSNIGFFFMGVEELGQPAEKASE